MERKLRVRWEVEHDTGGSAPMWCVLAVVERRAGSDWDEVSVGTVAMFNTSSEASREARRLRTAARVLGEALVSEIGALVRQAKAGEQS